jgi:hypothetical protein
VTLSHAVPNERAAIEALGAVEPAAVEETPAVLESAGALEADEPDVHADTPSTIVASIAGRMTRDLLVRMGAPGGSEEWDSSSVRPGVGQPRRGDGSAHDAVAHLGS